MSDIKKPEAKKAAAKKTTKPELPKLELWHISNEIENVTTRIHSLKSVIEMCAENTTDEPRSGSLWTAADYLGRLLDDLERQNRRLMEAHRKYLSAGGDKPEITFGNSDLGWSWED